MAKTQTNASTKVEVVHNHPTMRTFVNIGLVLAVITAIEFGIVYLEGMRAAVVAVLFILSLWKFYLVVAYFMHLKFDGKILSGVFAVGAILATLILIAQKFINLA